MPDHRQDRAAAVDALRDLNFAVQAFRESAADHFGVGVRETQAAAHLVTHGQLGAGDLGRLLDLTPSTITHLLGRLHRAGLAETAVDQDDHRRTVIRPTDRAHAMVAEVRAWLDTCFDSLDGSGVPWEVVLSVIHELRGGLQNVRESLRTSGTVSGPSVTSPPK